MTGSHDRDAERPGDMDTVATLIRAAGRRAEPPLESYERVLGAATAVWRAKVRRRSQWRVSAAIAAALLLVISSALLIHDRPPPPAGLLGSTDRIIGTVEMQANATGAWSTLRDEKHDVPIGSRIRTLAGSRAGLILQNGISVRLADATDIVLESGSRLRLLAGRMYLDTGESDDVDAAGGSPGGGQRIEVITPVGVASDLGTQFEVLYRDNTYRLRVREGHVRLRRTSGEIDSAPGEQLIIDAGGTIERARIPPQDAEWQWVQFVAPAPSIDAQPVTVLLAWVSRETGRPVRFDTPEIERRAARTILHGNIRHLAPLEALSTMLATTDLEHVLLEDGAILIRQRSMQ